MDVRTALPDDVETFVAIHQVARRTYHGDLPDDDTRGCGRRTPSASLPGGRPESPKDTWSVGRNERAEAFYLRRGWRPLGGPRVRLALAWRLVLWADLDRSGLPYDRCVIDLLRSMWDEPRPPGAPARVWRDWALVGVLVPLSVVEVLLRPDLPMRALSVVVVVGLVPALLWRRRRPLLTVAVTFGATGLLPLFTGRPVESYATASVLILVYALTRWGSGREIVLGVAVVAAEVVVDALHQPDFGDTVAGLAVLSACLALGAALRYRAGARRREVDRIRLLERERLARDLHDTVAHHVSAMAIRAQAGIATAALHPDAALDALRVIEAEASQALAEMRAMVRVLRRDGPVEPAELAPNPGIGDLAGLAGQAGARGGPRVDVGLSGDLDGVAAPVGAAIYRLAQESVTNARRHARHATRIEVRVEADDTSVRLRVSDDGEPGAARPAATPGFGLIGMIERADLLGGTCHAGPDAGRGWTVTAVLPRSGAPA